MHVRMTHTTAFDAAFWPRIEMKLDSWIDLIMLKCRDRILEQYNHISYVI